MEDDGGLVGVPEEELLGDVDEDRDGEEGEQGDGDLRAGAELQEAVGGLARHFVDETHGDGRWYGLLVDRVVVDWRGWTKGG